MALIWLGPFRCLPPWFRSGQSGPIGLIGLLTTRSSHLGSPPEGEIKVLRDSIENNKKYRKEEEDRELSSSVRR